MRLLGFHGTHAVQKKPSVPVSRNVKLKLVFDWCIYAFAARFVKHTNAHYLRQQGEDRKIFEIEIFVHNSRHYQVNMSGVKDLVRLNYVEVLSLLDTLGWSHYRDKFEAEKINGAELSDASVEDLVELGVLKIKAKSLFADIGKYKGSGVPLSMLSGDASNNSPVVDSGSEISVKRSPDRSVSSVPDVSTPASPSPHDASTQVKNALACYNGIDGEGKDHTEAMRLCRLAVAQGNQDAVNMLGVFHILGVGVARNAPEGLRHLQQAASKGNMKAQFNLGLMYGRGDHVSENQASALQNFTASAAQGYAPAQSALAVMYEKGTGVTQNATKARELFLQSAKGGFVEAQQAMGIICEKEKNYNEAASWFLKAAEQGDECAQFNLGFRLAHNDNYETDLYGGARWLKAAAEQGDTTAQLYLARLYRDHDELGCEDESGRWFKLAAEAGDEEAQCFLGLCYEFGHGGMNKDHDQAARWYKASAQKGFAEGQLSLGNMYAGGKGVAKDMSLALKFYKLASAQGHDTAKENVANIGNPTALQLYTHTSTMPGSITKRSFGGYKA